MKEKNCWMIKDKKDVHQFFKNMNEKKLFY